MALPSRIAIVSCLSLLSCGQTQDAKPPLASGGAPNAAAGSAGSVSAAGDGGGALPADAGRGGETAAAGAAADAGGSAADAGSAAAAAGSGTEEGGSGGEEGSYVQKILDTYRTFTPQTPEPVDVSGYIFGLCRLPTLREKEFQASIHGDGRYLQDWANALAVQGIATRGAPPFPAGAVIVKEKYAGPQAAQPDLVAIGLMIKREAGFDSANGDWDYAYYEPALGIVQSAEQSTYCANCHAGASATDFVFIDGLKP